MTTVYRWKDGAHIRINAKVAGAELERIRAAHRGRLTPRDVLEEAKNSASPLHKHFQWDDTEAAMQYRLQQAGHLIRSIEITVETTRSRGPSNVRAFVSVKERRRRSYTSVAEAMSDKDLRAQIVGRAREELQAWRERYEKLTEVAKIFEAIDKALPRLNAVRKAA